MAAPQVFKVLTEFKFEVGSAIASASGLQSAVQGVSSAADQLQAQFVKVGIGVGASLGLLESSALGVLGNILRAFDNLEKTQVKFAGIVFANRQFLTGINDANSALRFTDKLLTDIAKDAQKFGLNEKTLAQLTAITAGTVVKEGIGFSQARKFARNTLKAAPQLGIDAFSAQSQIQRAVLGGASQGDPAFRALATETDVFKKKFKDAANVAKAFNKLPLKERFETLNAAFAQFTQNSALLSKQANTISSIFLRIKQTLFGFKGVLQPLGKVLAGPVKDALKKFLTFLSGDFKLAIINLSKVIRQLIPDTETLIIRLQELSDVSKNFKKAGFFALILTLLPIIGIFRLIAKFGGPVIAFFTRIIAGAGGMVGIFAKLRIAFSFLITSARAFLKPLAIIFALFQIISRAAAIARVEDLKAFPRIINDLQESFARFLAVLDIVFGPLNDFITLIAEFISPLFRLTFLFESTVDVFKFLERTVVTALATISGVLTVLVGLVDSVRNFRFDEVTDTQRINDLFQVGMEGFLQEVFSRAGQIPGQEGGNPVSGNVTNIGKVEIRNEFKEQLEPDRIAFSLKEQLFKAAQNPREKNGRNASFRPIRQGN